MAAQGKFPARNLIHSGSLSQRLADAQQDIESETPRGQAPDVQKPVKADPSRPLAPAIRESARPRADHRASDDDPSGIGTYSQAGAQLGYGIGWTMLLSSR